MPTTSIRYKFSATGHQVVVGAFRSIGSAAASSARQVQQAARVAIAAQRMMNRTAGRVGGSSRAAQEARATQAALAKRNAALVRSLSKEKAEMMKSLAAFEAVEKKKTAAVAREGSKRVASERRSARRARRSSVGGGARLLGRIGRSGLSFAAIGLGIGAAAGVGAAVRENVQLEDQARNIAIRGRKVGGPRIDPTEIAARARRTAMEVPGVSGKDVLAGTDIFLERTGNLEKAQEAGKIIAELALASGTDMRDMASAAASLFDQFGVGEKNIEDLREQLSRFVIQGKKGAFEIKDLSKGMDRLAAAARSLGVDKPDLDQISVIGGLAQSSRRAAGGPARAVTALEGAFNVLSKKEGLIKKRHGFDVSATAKADFASLLPKLFEAIGGDKAKFENIFEKRSKTGVIDLFLEFKKLQEGGATLGEATEKLTQKIRDDSNAQGASAEVSRDLAEAQKTTGAKLTAAWENVVQAFGKEDIGKAVAELVDALATLAPAVKLGAEGLSAFFGGLKAVASAFSPELRQGFERAESQGNLGLKREQRKKLLEGIRTGDAKGTQFQQAHALDSLRDQIADEEARLVGLGGGTKEEKGRVEFRRKQGITDKTNKRLEELDPFFKAQGEARGSELSKPEKQLLILKQKDAARGPAAERTGSINLPGQFADPGESAKRGGFGNIAQQLLEAQQAALVAAKQAQVDTASAESELAGNLANAAKAAGIFADDMNAIQRITINPFP